MKILYVCTHNRCRSILSEAITNHLSNGRIEAFSAGSHPAGEVHPLSLKYLEELGFPTEGLQSQSWDEFDKEQFDVVITVCDSAANETCPVWLGDAINIHWGLPDPSKLQGSEVELREAFFQVIRTIELRVKKLLSLELENKTREEKLTLLRLLINEH